MKGRKLNRFSEVDLLGQKDLLLRKFVVMNLPFIPCCCSLKYVRGTISTLQP